MRTLKEILDFTRAVRNDGRERNAIDLVKGNMLSNGKRVASVSTKIYGVEQTNSGLCLVKFTDGTSVTCKRTARFEVTAG